MKYDFIFQYNAKPMDSPAEWKREKFLFAENFIFNNDDSLER